MSAIAGIPGRRPRVAFVWHGLPAYGAHLIRGAMATERASISVIATYPDFSIDPVDAVLPGIVQWHDSSRTISWSSVEGGLPDIAIVTGWGFPFTRRLAREAAAAKVPVILMSDNRCRGDVRQFVGKFVYRMRYKQIFSGAWVPGDSAASLLCQFGMHENRIFHGLYGANPAIFRSEKALASRSRRIVFVGQMIKRKGVDVLLDAFARSKLAQSGWQLWMFGSGPLSQLVGAAPGVSHFEFSQPDVIARALGDARICVLPSRDDNWGVALHEGAAAGCLLMATTAVGASADLIGGANGMAVRPGDAAALAAGLIQLASLPPARLAPAETESLAKAARFGPNTFSASFERICARFAPSDRLNP